MSSNTTKPHDAILEDANLKGPNQAGPNQAGPNQAGPNQAGPNQAGPILEPWRILALALIVAAGMLFVHLVVPADAATDAIGSASVSGQAGRP